MKEIRETEGCGRAEQLISFLYGESAAPQRNEFEQHLAACAVCRDEVASFARVRGAVADWRAELLRDAPAVTLVEALPPRAPNARAQRTAWDALREFFALTPTWLRAASAAAALAVFALAALAVLNADVRWGNGQFAFKTGLRTAQTDANGTAQPFASQDELARLSAERDAALRELEDTRAQLETSRAANVEAVYQELDESEALAPEPSAAPDERARARRPNAVPSARNAAPARNAPTSRADRTRRGEEDLPRLLDLLSEGS